MWLAHWGKLGRSKNPQVTSFCDGTSVSPVQDRSLCLNRDCRTNEFILKIRPNYDDWLCRANALSPLEWKKNTYFGTTKSLKWANFPWSEGPVSEVVLSPLFMVCTLSGASWVLDGFHRFGSRFQLYSKQICGNAYFLELEVCISLRILLHVLQTLLSITETYGCIYCNEQATMWWQKLSASNKSYISSTEGRPVLLKLATVTVGQFQ